MLEILPPAYKEREGNLNISSFVPTSKSFKFLKQNYKPYFSLLIQIFFENRHIEIVHKRHKAFQCAVCQHRFGSKQELARHFSKQHEGDTPHRCHLCDSNFIKKGFLTSHIEKVHLKNMGQDKKIPEQLQIEYRQNISLIKLPLLALILQSLRYIFTEILVCLYVFQSFLK